LEISFKLLPDLIERFQSMVLPSFHWQLIHDEQYPNRKKKFSIITIYKKNLKK